MTAVLVLDFAKRWIDENVEVDSRAAIRTGLVFNNEVVFNNKVEIKTGEGFGNFVGWLTDQMDGGFVEPRQWSEAMKQIGFRPEKDGDDWVIRGLKLKEE